MNKRHSAKQSYFTFFISLFITFQSRSLSPATLWIMKNAFACSGLTAAAQKKIKCASRRKRRAPFKL